MNTLVCGLLLPFLGTALGAGCVFFMKKSMQRSLRRMLTGFAAGVMTAASIWSLLIPAMDRSACHFLLPLLHKHNARYNIIQSCGLFKIPKEYVAPKVP